VSSAAASSRITCARCASEYVVAANAWFPACPRCGRAPIALRKRLQNNKLAAVLAVLAGAALAMGFSQPFMTMDKLGTRNTFSLVGGVLELFERGNVYIGAVLLIFSVVFPVAKICALLLATTTLVPLSPRVRHVLHRAADLTGKYSMLDVLVIAVIIVLVKFNGLAKVEAHGGTAWFCSAVLLSLLAGLFVKVQHPSPEQRHE
jgi:paraquat-inducible protein A